LTGLEIFAPYVLVDEFRDLQRSNWGIYHGLYESMIIGPIADFRKALPRIDNVSYDIVVFGDSIEHVEEADAARAIIEARRIARHAVIVTTPLMHERAGMTYCVPQSSQFGNDAEAHLKYWRREELEALGLVHVGTGELSSCFSMMV